MREFTNAIETAHKDKKLKEMQEKWRREGVKREAIALKKKGRDAPSAFGPDAKDIENSTGLDEKFGSLLDTPAKEVKEVKEEAKEAPDSPARRARGSLGLGVQSSEAVRGPRWARQSRRLVTPTTNAQPSPSRWRILQQGSRLLLRRTVEQEGTTEPRSS